METLVLTALSVAPSAKRFEQKRSGRGISKAGQQPLESTHPHGGTLRVRSSGFQLVDLGVDRSHHDLRG